MDDHLYSMIEQNIESLLDESTVTTRHENFLPYKCLETAAMEGPILGQYMKWSTVESDELNVQNHSNVVPFVSSHIIPTYNYLTVEMAMQNMLWNLWNAQFRQNMAPPVTKRTCSFCRKSGMSFAVYSSHSLRVNGVLHCPYLLKYQCNYCFKNGHTTGYCPLKATTTTIASQFFQNNPANRY